MKIKKILKNNWKLFLMASLTLGLAPFDPPHFFGKIQWLLGGDAFDKELGMQAMDWFDLLLHGSPWVLLFISAILHIPQKNK